jgi:hypothetical protein
VWTADALADYVALQAVAPATFAAGQARVFINHPHEHMLHN